MQVTHALWWRSTLFQGPTYLEHRSTRFPSGSPTFRDHLAEGLTNLERSSTLKHLSPWGLVYLRDPSTSGTRLPQGPVYLRDPSTSGTRLPQGPVYLRDPSTSGTRLPLRTRYLKAALPWGSAYSEVTLGDEHPVPLKLSVRITLRMRDALARLPRTLHMRSSCRILHRTSLCTSKHSNHFNRCCTTFEIKTKCYLVKPSSPILTLRPEKFRLLTSLPGGQDGDGGETIMVCVLEEAVLLCRQRSHLKEDPTRGTSRKSSKDPFSKSDRRFTYGT